MAETTPMSFRLEATLKSTVDAAARSQGISTTEFLERALKTALHTTCPTCGRSGQANVVAPGFSPQFEGWIADLGRVAVSQAFVVMTESRGEHWVHWVRLRDARPMDSGVLMVNVLLDPEGRRSYPMAIPRGAIVGWREDAEGRWYDVQRTLGYADGNTDVVRRLVAIEQAERMEKLGRVSVATRRGPSRTAR